MAIVWIQSALVALFFVATVNAASIASSSTGDGFWLNNLEAGKSFTFAIVPKHLGESMTVSFYNVDFSYTDCSQVEIDILDDGYIKRDYNRIATLCDAVSLEKFTATSSRGFHVLVKMGGSVTGGSIKARFTSPGGTMVTSERLYG